MKQDPLISYKKALNFSGDVQIADLNPISLYTYFHSARSPKHQNINYKKSHKIITIKNNKYSTDMDKTCSPQKVLSIT